jgi:F-type H+-transporting ATPase subunit b
MSRRAISTAASTGILLAQVAWAAEEEGAHHGGGFEVGPLLFSTINLLIFLWVLARFVLPPVRNWVAERRNRVVRELEEAAAAKAEAVKLRAEWEQRLAEFSKTVEEMRAHARRDAELERDRILEAARKTAETIRRDAERAAAYEVRRTQEQLRAELVRQAVRLAEETTRAQWSAADQQRFVAEFLKQVQP